MAIRSGTRESAARGLESRRAELLSELNLVLRYLDQPDRVLVRNVAAKMETLGRQQSGAETSISKRLPAFTPEEMQHFEIDGMKFAWKAWHYGEEAGKAERQHGMKVQHLYRDPELREQLRKEREVPRDDAKSLELLARLFDSADLEASVTSVRPSVLAVSTTRIAMVRINNRHVVRTMYPPIPRPVNHDMEGGPHGLPMR